MIDEAKTTRYKELLIRRDTLKKECKLIWLQYVKASEPYLKRFSDKRSNALRSRRKFHIAKADKTGKNRSISTKWNVPYRQNSTIIMTL
mgnify:CR=1 FL=1